MNTTSKLLVSKIKNSYSEKNATIFPFLTGYCIHNGKDTDNLFFKKPKKFKNLMNDVPINFPHPSKSVVFF